MRGHADVEPLRDVALRIVAPDLRAALIDDARAVGLRMPRVVIVVLGMPGKIGAVGLARVEIADPFGVGQEIDAISDPHRAREVALELTHPAERAAAFGIDPQVSGSAAAVALQRAGSAVLRPMTIALPGPNDKWLTWPSGSISGNPPFVPSVNAR